MGKETAARKSDPKKMRQAHLGPAPTDAPPVMGQAETQRAQARPSSASPGQILQLQRQYGNRAVQRMIQRAQGQAQRGVTNGLEGGEVGGDLQAQLDSARGGGQPLDRSAGSQLGRALDADFSGVRVHTDARADSLNRSLSAKAFTLGSDVFFRKGSYSPSTHSGKQLLAHELTHVVQQGGATQSAGGLSLRRSLGGVIQRDIDRGKFESKLKHERSFGNAYEELVERKRYKKLLLKINQYNNKQDKKHLKRVKSALGKLKSILKKDFLNAYEYLEGEIEKEETRLSPPQQSEKEIPPLREPPKPWDRQITIEDYDEGVEEKDEPKFLSSPPPLREPPKPWDRRFLPDEEDEIKDVSERGRTPLPFRSHDDDSNSDEEPSWRKPPKKPSWHQSPPRFRRGPDSDSEEEKPISFTKQSNRESPPPLRGQDDESSSSEEEPRVPYEDAVAARFSDRTGKIFKRLWETAPVEEKARIKSLFSVRKKHANLSGLEYLLEALDPQHRLEHFVGLADAAREWYKSDSQLYFFTWLAQQKDEKYQAPMGQVDYFDETQRQDYELKLGSTIKYAKSNKPLDGDNIYAVSQSNHFYASDRGKTDKGVIHHSSFMAGQAVKAAGHIEFGSPGKLAKINLVSGHYKPKPEHMKNALRILKRANVNLNEVIAQPDLGDNSVNAKLWLETVGKF